MNPTRLNTESFIKLKQWANKVSFYYFSPVYLVGSALSNDKFRDVDIILCINDEDFNLRYGIAWDKYVNTFQTGNYDDTTWNIALECYKRWKEANKYLGINIDFKIYPKSHFENLNRRYKDCIPLRLDGNIHLK